jgi:hypothetical protein
MPPRVLPPSTQLLGKLPRPRRLVKKEEISEARTPQDLELRQDPRLDDRGQEKRIEKARRLMFAKGVPATGRGVEELLSEKSLVSTCVHTNYRAHAPSGTDNFPLECPLEKPPASWISNVRDLRCRPTSRNRARCMEARADAPHSLSAHAAQRGCRR